MTDNSAASGATRPPWYADKDVPVLRYRVNRRPISQPTLDAEEEPPPFVDHLAETLLFGEEVVTTGRGRNRHWMLGNRELNPNQGFVSGWVGYRAEDAEEQDDYDSATKSWTTTRVTSERKATAPFVVTTGARFLFVAKHPTFAEGTLPVVFESLLNRGEAARQHSSTEWAVEPLLDDPDFTRWLRATAVLDSVSFHVRLPNPDAEESFAQIARHLDAQDAGALDHRLTPRDPDRGLAKDFESDSISNGLLEMARRAYAQIRARGRSAEGRVRSYSQSRRVRREPVHLSGSHEEAQRAVVQHGLAESANGGSADA